MVPNAGFRHVAPVSEFPEERWDSIVALLLTSPFLRARYAWPHLVASGEGRFIAIASVHGLVASPLKSAYVSAKHGLLGLVKTLALAGVADPISATAVCPAYVRTRLAENQIAAQPAAHGMSEDRVLEEVILAPQAHKRLIEPDEVAVLKFFARGATMSAEGAARAAVEFYYAARTRGRHPERISEDIVERLRHPIERDPYRAQLAAALAHDAGNRLQHIHAATLIIHGIEDRMVPLSNTEVLGTGIRRAELEPLSDVPTCIRLTTFTPTAGSQLS
jgi:3-hydroxybutyrate dehydrogenase